MTSITDKKLLIKTDEKWFEQVGEIQTDGKRVPRDKELELKREAEELLAEDVQKYQNHEKGSKKTDFGWIRSVLTKGSLTDKVAAHVLLIQDSAVHNLSSLSSLVAMTQSKGKREFVIALDHLKDLFLGDLLPSRKLKQFNELVVNVPNDEGQKETRARKQKLVLSYFEDQLRHNYHLYVQAVEKSSHDTLAATKNKAINLMYQLLANNPEQEQFLLENLVNKLGDPDSKVASHVSHLLQRLVTQDHPVMKDIVVTEVSRVLFRPNVTPKAQFYCLCFLSSLVFTDFDQLLANKLVDIYFKFFKTRTSSGDVNDKMMAALLAGMSRVLPYSTLSQTSLEPQIETFYKLIHFTNSNIAIQSLALIYSVIGGHRSASLSDRYYSVLYKFVLDLDFAKIRRTTMFLNLLYKSLKNDRKPVRVYAFLKRLLQVAIHSKPPILASILFLTSQVLNSDPKVSKIFNVEQKDRFSNIPDKNGLKVANVSRSNEKKALGDGDGSKNTKGDLCYDWNVRNPLFARSELENPFEVTLLCDHYHPSVSLFAQSIKDGQKVAYDGDPLEDFSIKHFLDRFVYRNPKQVTPKDALVARQSYIFGRQSRTRKFDRKVDSKEYLDLPESRIPLEERFIYKYLKEKPKVSKVAADDDNESVGSEEFEQLMDKLEGDFKDEDDFASELLNQGTKSSKKRVRDEDDFDDDDDEELEFDADQEYQAAFADVQADLEEVFDGLEEDEIPAKFVRKNRSKQTSRLFESADKFAHLLDGQSDHEDDGEDERPKKRSKLQKSGLKVPKPGLKTKSLIPGKRKHQSGGKKLTKPQMRK